MTGLTACSTLKIIHVPNECLGQPVLSNDLKFDKDDKMSDRTANKVGRLLTILSERINTQCKLNASHDRAHAKGR